MVFVRFFAELEKFELDGDNCPLFVTPLRSKLLAWKKGGEFCGICTISVVLSNSALSILGFMNLGSYARYDHLENLLKNETGTDTEILVGVSPNQKVVKCHRAFLFAESKVFQAMFESGLKEAKENKIEM